jgi:LysM repeat protein
MRLTLVFLFAGFSPVFGYSPLDSIGMTKQEGKFYIKYLVEPGETIYRLSTKYGIPISDLLELNPELENGLKTGQVLLIPYAPEKKPAAEADDNQYHTVEKGETFFSISRKYNIPVGDLLKANNIELKAGQKIVIKKGPSTASKPQEEDNSSNFNAAPSTKTENPVKTAPKETAKTEKSKEEKSAQVAVSQSNENTKPSIEPAKTSQAETASSSPTSYSDYSNSTKRVLVIPFDPYLYFSDADDEIAGVSHIHRTKVRQAFRKRLNAYLEPRGFETIHLLGGTAKDSTTDLNRIYSSISYTYDDVMMTGVRPEEKPIAPTGKGNGKKETTNPNHPPTLQSRASLAKDDAKYFAVKIKDPNFFPFFDAKYHPDFFIFVSQFEIKTNYENCLDRARQNYERTFVTHFSIFDKTGIQISGGKLKSNYESGTNNLEKILADNIPSLAERIMAELPK